jgi:hypothetical protein
MTPIGRTAKRISGLIAAIWLGFFTFGSQIVEAEQQDPQRFELRIENGRLIGALKIIRVRHNEAVEINWSADSRTVLHLHGYDIESTIEPGKPQTMSFTARATGRFPIETHGGRHAVIIYLEVHPR